MPSREEASSSQSKKQLKIPAANTLDKQDEMQKGSEESKQKQIAEELE